MVLFEKLCQNWKFNQLILLFCKENKIMMMPFTKKNSFDRSVNDEGDLLLKLWSIIKVMKGNKTIIISHEERSTRSIRLGELG